MENPLLNAWIEQLNISHHKPVMGSEEKKLKITFVYHNRYKLHVRLCSNLFFPFEMQPVSCV